MQAADVTAAANSRLAFHLWLYHRADPQDNQKKKNHRCQGDAPTSGADGERGRRSLRHLLCVLRVFSSSLNLSLYLFIRGVNTPAYLSSLSSHVVDGTPASSDLPHPRYNLTHLILVHSVFPGTRSCSSESRPEVGAHWRLFSAFESCFLTERLNQSLITSANGSDRHTLGKKWALSGGRNQPIVPR
ncbi:hypothetical protein B0H13DRAFT_131416 [Mycena leptocephala]|nr:hypothetical protein B0H13DRAFT_131416 [Mycena leptocephala]